MRAAAVERHPTAFQQHPVQRTRFSAIVTARAALPALC
jgi:hypothetical protein